jgi:FtsZ-binding cell division protein ZapB
MLKMIAALTILIVLGVGISQVFGEDYQVQVSENGFEHSYLAINSGDTVTFVNVHYVTSDGITEPHCISDPFAVPYTELSCHMIADSVTSVTYTLTSDQTFYDRFFEGFSPVVVDVSETTSDTDMDTAPDYTGDTDVIALQADLAEVTLDLTNALSTIGILQAQVTDLQSQLANAVVDVSPYTDQIDLLVEERDQWKQLAENWYAVALEQVRVMVEVLGL